jgi:hypothetical protein
VAGAAGTHVWNGSNWRKADYRGIHPSSLGTPLNEPRVIQESVNQGAFPLQITKYPGSGKSMHTLNLSNLSAVCTENPIRVAEVTESPKLAE